MRRFAALLLPSWSAAQEDWTAPVRGADRNCRIDRQDGGRDDDLCISTGTP